MYVRLAFSVAAHLEPDILLVDEVLAVGDAAFQKKCLGKMGSVAQEGRTVLFISHNMAAVKSLCSRCILLEAGRLHMDSSSYEVIQHYLGSGDRNYAMRVWEDPNQAPGNEAARLYSVGILDGSGKVSADIRSDQEFIIEIKYTIKQDGLRAGATAVVFNQEGTCVFSSMSNREEMWHGKPHPVGSYRSTCWVPQSLLPDGEYSLTILLWEGNYNLICREGDATRFHIIESGEVRVDYFRGWEGVVRPSLRWTTEKVSSFGRC
jgi:lipopolysaccharide transport system ATP-binding protein